MNNGQVEIYETKEAAENETKRTPGEVVEVFVTAKDLAAILEDVKLFAEWVEVLGRTDCEIYKHELKANSDLALERIERAIGA